MTSEQTRELQILQIICVITMYASGVLGRKDLIERSVDGGRRYGFLITEQEVEQVLCKSVQCIILENKEWS
jgi:hypothetical protein